MAIGNVFAHAKHQTSQALRHWATGTWRVTLLMTNTTADLTSSSGQDATTIGNINTLDEFDGANFTTADRQVLANRTLTEDLTNNWVKLVADDVTWTTQAAGTRKIQGALVYFVSGTFSQSIPIAYVSLPSSFAANGGSIKISWSSNGVVRFKNA